jgi:hypothetical protein
MRVGIGHASMEGVIGRVRDVEARNRPDHGAGEPQEAPEYRPVHLALGRANEITSDETRSGQTTGSAARPAEIQRR